MARQMIPAVSVAISRSTSISLRSGRDSQCRSKSWAASTMTGANISSREA